MILGILISQVKSLIQETLVFSNALNLELNYLVSDFKGIIASQVYPSVFLKEVSAKYRGYL